MEKIPKKLHYCWFGNNPKGEIFDRCLKSWKKYAPNFEIYEWNESNSDLSSAPKYVQDALREKKWAFVSDYIRMAVLDKIGGVYVDTDMELVKDISPLLSNQAFLGFENSEHINNAIMGAVSNHPFVKKTIRWYEENNERTPTPIVITSIFEKIVSPQKIEEKEQEIEGVHIYPHITFYPYDKDQIKKFSYDKLTTKTYAVHFWNYSWGHPLNRFFKQVGIYNFGKKIVEVLGVKKILKKLFGFE